MSVCSACLKACNIPLCTDQIIIGTISSITTDVKIIIENKTKGGKRIVSTQSDGAGLVTLATDGLGLMPDQTYNISIILNTATALCDTETITIGNSTASCISVIFENIKDTEGCQVEFESQTLTAIVDGENANVECCYLGIFEGTYAEIVAALVTGIDTARYSHVRITDFQTIYDQPDFDNTGTAKTVPDIVTKTSSVTEPLLIALLDANTLQAEAHSALYPQDKIRYDITFNATEVNGTAAKGRITERIDHLNNRTDYDHRHVVFKRYESAPASGIFNQFKDNGGASQEFTTFQFAAETPATGFSNNNYIGDYALLFSLYGNPFILSNNVFGVNAESNVLPQYAINNTFGINAHDNIINDDLVSCIFGNGFSSNFFGSMFSCDMGESCSDNSFDGTVGIICGDRFNRNIGGAVGSCVFGDDCVNNNFGVLISELIFTDNAQNNTIQNILQGIDFTGASHVYGVYSCSIFKNQTNAHRLSYFDAADALIIVSPTA